MNTNNPTQLFYFGADQALSAYVQFDSATESHDPRIDWTDHPVEEGQDVTDHAQVKPYRFSIRGIVTETPFPMMVAGNPGLPIAGADRILGVYNILEKMSGNLIDVGTARWGVLTPCGIESYRHDVDAMGRVIFNISLKRIRIATTQIVQIPPLSTAIPGASTAANVGAQSLKTPAATSPEVSTTAATIAKLLDVISAHP